MEKKEEKRPRFKPIDGEPVSALKMETELIFRYRTLEPCSMELKLTNPTKDRFAFKIKTTDNALFKVQPSIGFLPPNGQMCIKVSLTVKTLVQPSKHYVAVFNVKVDEKCTDAKAAFEGGKLDGVQRVVATCEREIVDETADAGASIEAKK
ncbi:unnamed protein product [Caenorhabditis auriculariae]|uniref:Major sperm protein n=1 Tax=Caenorhabditis auriculariae TaxID=2777116 RepID=A0A8S1GYX5_9PELO|nr:unnamed protein product [Caenorhabditis auriculariae]